VPHGMNTFIMTTQIIFCDKCRLWSSL